MDKLVVYTANFGNKDDFNIPQYIANDIDFYYFTDNKDLKSNVWKIKTKKPLFDSSRLSAKWFKMHSHLLFPGKITIWHDANYRLTGHPQKILSKKKESLILFKHPERCCIYEESKIVIKRHAVQDPVKLQEQIEKYKQQGCPPNVGLYEGNCLIRRPDCQEFNEKWWKEILQKTERDQVSLAFLLWKKEIDFWALTHDDKKGLFGKCGKHSFHGTKIKGRIK